MAASKDARSIIIRAHIFINHYILVCLNQQEEIPSSVFKQNFWYSVYQLMNGKRVTNSNALLRDAFRTDTRNNNNATYDKTTANGVIQCLTEVCIKPLKQLCRKL
jgi:hypothetical protein